MDDKCQLCQKRISQWEMVNQKHQIINQKLYHKACLMDATIADIEAGTYTPKETK